MERVMIIGSPGAGKSTLALALAAKHAAGDGRRLPRAARLALLWYIIRFPWAGRRRNERDLADYPGRVVRLKSLAAARAFIEHAG